jgi:16S rRNA (cytosine967-C5)-methyltransferase
VNTRAQAAKILIEVLQKQRSLSAAMAAVTEKNNKGFIQELCYGVLRWHGQLDAIAKKLLEKPLKEKDRDIYILILIGLYQLLHLQTPAHAAINETVAAARDLKKIWATGLINALLRRFQREQISLLNIVEKDLLAHYSHPAWLLKILQQAWPEQWETIVNANNQRPPLTLRVNQLKITRDDYLHLLTQQNIAAQIIEATTAGIVLAEACDVTKLPKFVEGFISVQDAAAQLAAELLELQPQQLVLDACAAPGGKTAHILETEANLGELVVMDIEEKRLEKIKDNLNRLQPSPALSGTLSHRERGHPLVKLLCADAAQPQAWWDGKLFDRILLDAPCSATGVIRRHPDIKFLRRAEDIQQLAAVQEQLLNALWLLLKPDGILLYATCSVLPQENNLQIEKFLAAHKDASKKMEQQIFPGENTMDGFYYAQVKKITH